MLHVGGRSKQIAYLWPPSKPRSSTRAYLEVNPRPCSVWLKLVTKTIDASSNASGVSLEVEPHREKPCVMRVAKCIEDSK